MKTNSKSNLIGLFKCCFFIQTIIAISLVLNPFNSTNANEKKIYRYVAIGDSYTIGEGVSKIHSWPSQLTAKLIKASISIELIANPSQTGWATTNAIQSELPILRQSQPNFVTLLLGFNDWIRHSNGDLFKKKLTTIIDAILKEIPSKKQLLVVTIPDFSCSPKGSQFGFGKSAVNGISRFNSIIKEISKKKGLALVDIFTLSQELCKEPEMFAKDGLHPSAKQYEKWVDAILPTAISLFKN